MQKSFGVSVAGPSFSSLCHREEVVAWLECCVLVVFVFVFFGQAMDDRPVFVRLVVLLKFEELVEESKGETHMGICAKRSFPPNVFLSNSRRNNTICNHH